MIFFFASCSSPYLGRDVCGAEEFVVDSYCIREGKFRILELEGELYEEIPSYALQEYQDTIGEGDVLEIVIHHPKKEVTRAIDEVGTRIGYKVKDGLVHLPGLEPIFVEGLTLHDAACKIQREYDKDAHVFVSYKDRTVKKVELAGMVEISHYPVDGKVRLYDVLCKAKIPTEANLFRSYVLREDRPLSVDLHKLIKMGDMSQNIVMRAHDKIYIAEPTSAQVMMMGEVVCERLLNVPKGYISLREAIAAAGGIPFTGDKSYIQVIRGSFACPRVYTLNWEHIICLPNDSLLLIPGDVVYVASKPITEWNRFISQIIPSFGGVERVKKSCTPCP